MGRKKCELYINALGEYELEGINDPPKQELFSFKWRKFSQDNPRDGIVKIVYDHLEHASVEPYNLKMPDLANPGIIIWPVVPRNLATAIHRGQAEIIRLLALLGWSVTLLIADCGIENSDRTYSEAFFNAVKKYTEGRGIINIDLKQSKRCSHRYTSLPRMPCGKITANCWKQNSKQ
jgi:hypothetical protein